MLKILNKMTFKPLVSLYLTDAQTVIRHDPSLPHQQISVPNLIYGPLTIENDLKYEFKSQISGASKQFDVSYHLHYFQVFTTVSGEIFRVY